MQQCRLARARFAHQSQHFAARDIEREIGEDGQVGAAGFVNLGKVARANVGVGCQRNTIARFGSRQSADAKLLFCAHCPTACSAAHTARNRPRHMIGIMATMQPNKPFLSDIEQIRARARKHMEKGAVTDAYKADLQTVLRLLNEALATEIVCVLRYKRHQFTARGLSAQSIAEEFAEHASEEQAHADMIAHRIVELGGEPNFSPEGLASRSHSEYVEGETLVDMIKEDLVAERIAIESYSEIIRFLGNNDTTSRRVMEEILAKEEEHAEDMLTLIERVEKAGL